MTTNFIKMNGAGNDFIIFDARKLPVNFAPQQIRAIAARENPLTKGCDQVIVMRPSQQADVFMQIYNADGSEVDACGNATRCIGWKIIEERQDIHHVTIETNAGILHCKKIIHPAFPPDYHRSDDMMEANMGHPRFKADEIPVGGGFDSAVLGNIANELGINFLVNATCIGMGNPHVVFFVSQLPALSLLISAGEKIKTIALFEKHGVNLTIAEVGEQAVFSYVFERGAGVTKSCGTAACATAVAAISLGYRKKNIDIWIQQMQYQQEDLFVRWEEKTNDVYLIGPVKKEFENELNV